MRAWIQHLNGNNEELDEEQQQIQKMTCIMKEANAKEEYERGEYEKAQALNEKLSYQPSIDVLRHRGYQASKTVTCGAHRKLKKNR